MLTLQRSTTRLEFVSQKRRNVILYGNELFGNCDTKIKTRRKTTYKAIRYTYY